MNSPFFTVIIPTYNRMELLRESIQSVLDQTFKDFELLIIDDLSIDNTWEVVASFQDERIKYILNDRSRGGAGARNAGIFMAKGEWVAFLDDDDVYLPQKLKLQYEKIKQVNDSVGLVYVGSAIYDFNEKEEISQYLPQKEGWIQNDLLYSNHITSFSTVAIKRDLLWKLGGLDERFEAMQDMELYVRIAGLSMIAYVKDKLVYIRKSNPDRISLNTRKKLMGSVQFRDKYKDIINKDLKARHHNASRVFMFAVKEKNMKYLFKALPWTMYGIFFDVRHFVRVCWSVILMILKSSKA
jgi:glycosyltransferase involved in cell wall biosynthesis